MIAAMDTDYNGILASIPGQYVSLAIDRMGIAGMSVEPTTTLDLNVAGFGQVRFTARRLGGTSKRSHAAHYYWSVIRAEKVQPVGDDDG